MRTFKGLLYVALTVSLLNAQPDNSEPKWFLGFAVGNLDEPERQQFADIFNQRLEDDTFSVHGGYQFSKTLAWTLSYADYGSRHWDFLTDCPDLALCIPDLGEVDWTSLASGLAYSWMANSWLRLQAESSLANIKTRKSLNTFLFFTTPHEDRYIHTESYRQWALKVTAEAEFRLSKRVAGTLDYSRFEVEGGSRTGFEQRASVFSLGTRYRF